LRDTRLVRGGHGSLFPPMSDKIIIFDATLRDGEQCPGASMNLREKMELARQLVRLNVDVVEAGFPVSSEGDFEAVQRIATEVRGPGRKWCGSGSSARIGGARMMRQSCASWGRGARRSSSSPSGSRSRAT
jgi:hypothetical protein